MLNIIISTTSVASFFLLILILNISNPVNAGPIGILFVFTLAYVSLSGFVALFLYAISRLLSHLSLFFISRVPYRALEMGRAYYYSTIIAAAPIMLIGMQSVGSVGFYEILLVIIFVLIGCLYITKKLR